jgi:hypothetical protein
LQGIRNGASIGLHADTLIGPIRLDFGAGEDRRYLVYFSAGFDFQRKTVKCCDRAAERTTEKAASDEAAFGRTGSVDA